MSDKTKTHIVVVLDRSGSMQSMRGDMEGALNAFVEDQRKVDGEATFTLVQFDDRIETVHDAVDLNEVPTLSLQPRGTTALLDAMGGALRSGQEYVKSIPKKSRPKNRIFCVITDGLENASKEWKKDQIVQSIQEAEKDGWLVTYLGANQDAISVGESYGFAPARSASFAVDGGSRPIAASFANMASTYRGGETLDRLAYSKADREAALKGDKT